MQIGNYATKDTLSIHPILILGGYGFFGTRISRALAANGSIRLLIGGRDLNQARQLVQQLGFDPEQAVAIDAEAPDLAQRLVAMRVATVIHTAGQALSLEWQLLAAQIHGPHIPCGGAIALATKLARGDALPLAPCRAWEY